MKIKLTYKTLKKYKVITKILNGKDDRGRIVLDNGWFFYPKDNKGFFKLYGKNGNLLSYFVSYEIITNDQLAIKLIKQLLLIKTNCPQSTGRLHLNKILDVLETGESDFLKTFDIDKKLLGESK